MRHWLEALLLDRHAISSHRRVLSQSVCWRAAVSVIGYVFIQPALEARFKIVDTCGVHNLHGMPGLLGALIAMLVVPGIAVAQFIGIIFSVTFAFVTGLIAGAADKGHRHHAIWPMRIVRSSRMLRGLQRGNRERPGLED